VPILTLSVRAIRVEVTLLPTSRETRTLDLDPGSRVEDAMRALGLYPDAWVPVRGDTPVPVDEELKDGDRLKLVAAVSGG
jgi:sulfur carrier protein